MSRHSTCIIEGCEATTIRARGWCDRHYERWRKHGDPLLLKHVRGDDMRRFMRYVDKESHPDGCWLWTGAKRSGRAAERGEFQVYVDGVRKKKLPYRWYYEQIHGPIPDGFCCMHTCFNGHIGCINPAHIRVGTDAENANMADRTGENHHAARVPDSVVAESIARVRAGEPRAAVAKSLTARGWSTGATTVGAWVCGRNRATAKAIQEGQP